MSTDENSVGANVRRLRQRAGKSRAALAGLVGRSDDWLKKVESGKRGLPLEVGVILARVLNVPDLSELYGPQVSAPVPQSDRPNHPAIDAVGAALSGYTVPEGEPPTAEWLRAAVNQTWKDWHESPVQRSYAAETLPALIRAGRAAVRGHTGMERRQARAALGDVMHFGQAFLAWQSNAHHWYWLAVDRGQTSGEDADDPIAYATSLLYTSFALRVTDREDEALALLRTATDTLAPSLMSGDDDVRGLWGAVQLARASTMARHQRDPSAWTHWEGAERMLAHVPHGYSHQHGYSRGHVQLHQTWLAQLLGDSTEALRHAEHVDVDGIPSRNWQAAHLINVAKALHQRRDSGAIIPLMQACQYSSEAVKFSLPAREVIATLAHTGQTSTRIEAGKLARQLEIPVLT